MVSKTTSAYQCYFLGYSSFRMSHCEFAPQQVVPHMIPNQFGRSQVARPVDCTAVRCCLEGSDLEVYPQVSISTSRDPFVDPCYSSYHHSKAHFDKAYFFGGCHCFFPSSLTNIGRKYHEHIGILYITYFIAFTCNYSLTTT